MTRTSVMPLARSDAGRGGGWVGWLPLVMTYWTVVVWGMVKGGG